MSISVMQMLISQYYIIKEIVQRSLFTYFDHFRNHFDQSLKDPTLYKNHSAPLTSLGKLQWCHVVAICQ